MERTFGLSKRPFRLSSVLGLRSGSKWCRLGTKLTFRNMEHMFLTTMTAYRGLCSCNSYSWSTISETLWYLVSFLLKLLCICFFALIAYNRPQLAICKPKNLYQRLCTLQAIFDGSPKVIVFITLCSTSIAFLIKLGGPQLVGFKYSLQSFLELLNSL